ncbi:MAG: ribonuclease PH [Bdellovibrionota bacterium]
MRNDGRKPNEIRSVRIQPDIIRHAEGSVMIEMGHTRLICTASVEPGIPKWLSGQGSGWVTAEYGMLPRSTHSRIQRDKAANGGRTQEISRLIGRSLRAAIDLKALGERQILVDCDVVQADGGTRTAAITGGFVALALALQYLKDQGQISKLPIKHQIAAISVGLSANGPLLDLDYNEDSSIETDMNFVMNEKNEFIEIQGTAENGSFSMQKLNEMVELAQLGCRQLFAEQKKLVQL